jgi:hypothetical protein
MPRIISPQLFGLRGFTQKHDFLLAFDDNLSVTHVFIKQIFRAAQQVSPHPLSTVLG